MVLFFRETFPLNFESRYLIYSVTYQVLAELKKDYKLYVITNGIGETQNFRMKGSGLDRYFEKCFISEIVGANKPSSLFFDHVKENIDGFDHSKALVIGDSLTSDIKGGNLAGICRTPHGMPL